MPWIPLDISWRSLIAGEAISADRAPFVFQTPETPWVYGAISDVLPDTCRSIIRLRMATTKGRASAALSMPNGSAFLSEELDLDTDDGVQDLYFELAPTEGSVAIVLRNFGVGFSVGRVIALETGGAEDLAAERSPRIAGPPAAVDVNALTLSKSNIAYAHELMQPVSLGNTCEAKLQICRVLQYRFRSDVSLAKFRMMMAPPARSRDVFGWDLFDWQGTSLNSVLYYFEKDFSGLYEREDLITDGFSVLNKRSGAEHRHDYEILRYRDEPITEQLIDEGHPSAKLKFEYMAAAFRDRLTSPGPFLYVYTCENFPTEYRVRTLMRQLASRSPDHRFHLLVVGLEDENHNLHGLSDQVTIAHRPRPKIDAHPFEWGPQYEAWDHAFANFRLRMLSR